MPCRHITKLLLSSVLLWDNWDLCNIDPVAAVSWCFSRHWLQGTHIFWPCFSSTSFFLDRNNLFIEMHGDQSPIFKPFLPSKLNSSIHIKEHNQRINSSQNNTKLAVCVCGQSPILLSQVIRVTRGCTISIHICLGCNVFHCTILFHPCNTIVLRKTIECSNATQYNTIQKSLQ